MNTNKYHALLASLNESQTGKMKCYGNSMLPILTNPCLNLYAKKDTYGVGDIVFCKVNGRFIDAHIISAIRQDGDSFAYKISNNHGHDNGWTRTVYAKVMMSWAPDGKVQYRAV